jgi:hypothetical protein
MKPPEDLEELVHTTTSHRTSVSPFARDAPHPGRARRHRLVFSPSQAGSAPHAGHTAAGAGQSLPRGAGSAASRLHRNHAASGIKFVHHNGAEGDKLLPETMGAAGPSSISTTTGIKTSCSSMAPIGPGPAARPTPPPTAALYRNDGQGHFEDITAGSGLDVSFYGMGAALGDFDNDGQVDVFITGVGGQSFVPQHRPGQIRRRHQGHGHGWGAHRLGALARPGWTTTTTAKLDLLVGNYVRWSKENRFRESGLRSMAQPAPTDSR